MRAIESVFFAFLRLELEIRAVLSDTFFKYSRESNLGFLPFVGHEVERLAVLIDILLYTAKYILVS